MPSADENSKANQTSRDENTPSGMDLTVKLAEQALTEASERWNREQARKKKKEQ